MAWLNPQTWVKLLVSWETFIVLIALAVILKYGGGKVIETIVDLWAELFRPIFQAVGEIVQQLLLDLWHVVQDAAKAAWSVLKGIISFGGADTFDNTKTAAFYIGSIALTALLCITFLRGTLPPVKASQCPEVSASVRADYWLLEKSKAPHGVMARPAK